MSMLMQEATDAGPVPAKPEHIAAGSSSPESQTKPAKGMRSSAKSFSLLQINM